MTSITSEFERHPISSHRRPFRLLATRHRRKRWPREPPTASREQILVSSWPEFPILGTITCKFQLPVPPILAASHPPTSNQASSSPPGNPLPDMFGITVRDADTNCPFSALGSTVTFAQYQLAPDRSFHNQRGYSMRLSCGGIPQEVIPWLVISLEYMPRDIPWELIRSLKAFRYVSLSPQVRLALWVCQVIPDIMITSPAGKAWHVHDQTLCTLQNHQNKSGNSE